MKRPALFILLMASIGCATIKGETTIVHPSINGNQTSRVWIRAKDYRLPYMKFAHVAEIQPVATDIVKFQVRTFSTTKSQIDPAKTKFYLMDDQGHLWHPADKSHVRIIEKNRDVRVANDVAGQEIRVHNPDGTEYYQMHYLQENEYHQEYYFGICTLFFNNAGMINDDTKSLTLVAEQEGRKILFIWHITKNPAEASLEVSPYEGAQFDARWRNTEMQQQNSIDNQRSQ